MFAKIAIIVAVAFGAVAGGTVSGDTGTDPANAEAVTLTTISGAGGILAE